MPASIADGFLSLLAPPRCPGCDLPFTPTRSLQPTGAHTHPGGFSQPGCLNQLFCPACAPLIERAPRWLAPPASIAAAWRFEGPLADAIRRFKYAGAGRLAAPLGLLLSEVARPYLGLLDAVVPLPLHRSKLRSRGYNPAALLGRSLARELGVPLRVDLLRRERATRSQAGLDREARLSNVRGAFQARARPPAKLLLLDDVRTTGATLAEAATTLTARGHTVTTLALAWAEA